MMTDHEFEQLLRADSKKFALRLSFTPLHANHLTKQRRYKTIGRALKYGLALSLSLVFAGLLIYRVLDATSNTATATDKVSNALSKSTVMQMVQYGSSYSFPFTVYIPVGGLNAPDYQVKAMSGLPGGGIDFVLSSKQRQTFMSIEEYSPSQELPSTPHPWIKMTDSRTGQTYWERTNASKVEDYYFMKDSTKIMVEETHPFTKSYFPQNLWYSLKPLASFGTQETGTGQSN